MGSYTDIYRTASNVTALAPNRKPFIPKPDPYRQIADDMAAKAQTQQAIDNQPPPPPAAPQQTSAPVPPPAGGANFAMNPVVTSNMGQQAPATDPLAVAINSQTQPGAMQPKPWRGEEDPRSDNPFGTVPGTVITDPNDPGADQTQPGDQPQPDNDWEQRLKDALAKSGDFDPTQQLMNEQRDAALRQLAESGASRGMGSSGFEDAMAGDIYRGTARDSAKAYQDFQQQEIENQMQGAQMLMQDDWKNMDQDQQRAMAELMYRIGRKEKYGENWNPQFGDANYDAWMSILNNPDSMPAARTYATQGLYKVMGYENFYSMYHQYLNANEMRDLFSSDPEAAAWLEKQAPKPKKDGGEAQYEKDINDWELTGGRLSGKPEPNHDDYV
jgi:hypothetical protein